MSEARKKADWTIVAVVLAAAAVVLAAFGVYVGAYFAMGEVWTFVQRKSRRYDAKWIAAMFEPAAKVESLFTGSLVETWTATGGIPLPTYLSPSDHP